MTSPRKLIPPIVLACLAGCATPPPGPRCPDKSVPRFSGHPFLPNLCPKDLTAPRRGSGQLYLTQQIMPVVAASSASFAPMAGNWEGWAMYDNDRFQVTISVRQGQPATLQLAATEYVYHRVNKLQAELTASTKEPGLYDVKVTDLALPRSPLKAKAWLGTAPAPQTQGLDRSFVIAYKSLAALHEFRFKFDGPGKLWYVYTYRQAGQEPVSTSGTLNRTDRDAF